MAIATFPNGLKPTSIKITSETQTVVTHSHSFARQARTRGGQRWQVEYTYPTMTRTQISPLLGFVMAQNGKAGEFEIDPAKQLFTSTGTTAVTGTLSPVEAYSATSVGGGIVVNATSTDVIDAGTFIKFSNHSKVYMTTQPLEITATASGVYQQGTIRVLGNRDTNSPKLAGNITISLGSVASAAIVTVTVATLATDTNTGIATKMAAAIGAVDGFGATAVGAVVTVVVNAGLTGNLTRQVYVQNLISSINVGVTGVKAAVDNFVVTGKAAGGPVAALYFDPPLREAITAATTIAIAPINSVPFTVAMSEDMWNTSIDEVQHYNGFKLTFQESY